MNTVAIDIGNGRVLMTESLDAKRLGQLVEILSNCTVCRETERGFEPTEANPQMPTRQDLRGRWEIVTTGDPRMNPAAEWFFDQHQKAKKLHELRHGKPKTLMQELREMVPQPEPEPVEEA